MTKRILDLDNYKRMSKPYETEMDASVALQGFLTEVMAARQRWRVSEVVVGCSTYFGPESSVLSMFQQLGDLLFAPILVEQMQRKTLEELMNIVIDQSREIQELKSVGQMPLLKDENETGA